MNIKQKFKASTINWENKINHDEWFFKKFRDDITKDLDEIAAFEMIPEVVNLIIEQNHEYLCIELFEVLLYLARLANTTEMSETLMKKWNELEIHVSSFGHYHEQRFDELKSWYRK